MPSPCAYGLTDCHGCLSLAASTDNCGACANKCLADKVCIRGRCEAVGDCPDGLTNCNGNCVDLKSDASSCGACGQRCGRGQMCTLDVSGSPKCVPYFPAPCRNCPCAACGSTRTCCLLAGAAGAQALCVEGRCPGR